MQRLLAAALIVAAACTPATTEVATTTGDTGVVTSLIFVAPQTTTMPSAPATTGTTAAPQVAESTAISGTLPDGTAYEVTVEPRQLMSAQGISGVVMIDLDDGGSRAIGVTSFLVGSTEPEPSFNGSRLRVPTAGGLVTIDLYDEVLQYLAPDAERILIEGLHPVPNARLPALELTPPFRWATDDELTVQMGVDHGHFEVRRGCDEALAVACSQTRAVQVIPTERLYSQAPEWPLDVFVWIESPAPRPVEDAHYLDPGPLLPRAGASVMWTGEEMIVWGGADTDRPPDLVDGAAFDPVAGTWRMLPESPLDGPQRNKAVWADDRMIVVGRDVTVAYDPATDQWSTIGDGAEPPVSPRLIVWTGDQLVTMHQVGELRALDEASGEWVAIEDPGFGNGDPWSTSLSVVDGNLVVSALRAGNCTGRRIATRTAGVWVELPEVSLETPVYADCSFPHQAAWIDGRLIIWDDVEHPTMALDVGADAWREIATITLSGTEGPDGPLLMGDRLLVSQYGEAAIYDAVEDSWTAVRLPGGGSSHDMIWTGFEVLMWGAACCFGTGDAGATFDIDAWRWIPPLERDGVDIGEIECEPFPPMTEGFDFTDVRCVSTVDVNGVHRVALIRESGGTRVIVFGANGITVTDVETAPIEGFADAVIEVAVDGSIYAMSAGRRVLVLDG